jgi:hypothetical protein
VLFDVLGHLDLTLFGYNTVYIAGQGELEMGAEMREKDCRKLRMK